MTSRLSAIIFLLLCGLPMVSQGAAEVETFRGKHILVDDRYFEGCFHNAFEGTVERAEDGTIRRGHQGIKHTKGVLCGVGTNFASMAVAFDLRNPELPATMTLRGLDDHLPDQNPVTVVVNGQVVAKALRFPDNDTSVTKNPRYFIGWTDVQIPIPDGVLKAKNRVELRNSRGVFTSPHWNHVIIDSLTLDFDGEQEMTLRPPPMPRYYYGLNKGIELIIWPSMNLDGICLVKDSDLAITFAATMPNREAYLGPKKGWSREMSLLVVSDGDFTLFDQEGKAFAQRPLGDGRVEHRWTGRFRLPLGVTPHPDQGVAAYIRAHSEWTDGELTAWFQVDGVEHQRQRYSIQAAALPDMTQKPADFSLAIWGATAPRNASRMDDYAKLLKRVGIDRVFVGKNVDVNARMKQAGFEVIPRFGWFGRRYKLKPEHADFAAVGPDGVRKDKDFCPLQILANEDDAEIGKYFRRVREHAALTNIDALCVDYENPAVWCWCERCLQLFADETGIQAPRAALVEGELMPHYRDFGRRLNRRILARVREVMHTVNPELRYVALASVSDLPTYWQDGRDQKRHAARELVKFADEIAISGYFYELPGGLKSVPHLIETTRRYAMEAKRNVDVSMIVPIANTVKEASRYGGMVLGPKALRLLIVLAKTSGAKGLAMFRGDCFDGLHYLAIQQGLGELGKMQGYLGRGMDRSRELVLRAVPPVSRHTNIWATQNILSRKFWQPDEAFDYQVVQLLRDSRGDDRLVLLFNFAKYERVLNVGTLGMFADNVSATDFATGQLLAQMTRRQLEDADLQVAVPPQDIRMIRLVSN